MHTVREFGNGVLDLLFPPVCLVCGELAEPFCETCRAAIRPVTDGGRIPPGVSDARSVGWHDGPLREAVLRLKLSRKVALAGPLAELLAAELATVAARWRATGLVPVPSHWTRRLERGFNQSDLLAEALSCRCGLPVRRALRKVRQTPPQVGLTAPERARNLRGAFAPEPGCPVVGARLTLIDDVRTTGATLAECASVLRANGAVAVFALTDTSQFKMTLEREARLVPALAA